MVLAAVLLVLALLADWEAIKENFFDSEVARSLWPEIITVAAKNTIVYTIISFVGGLALAVVLALMRLSPVGPYRWLATAYIEFFRGLPALLVIVASGSRSRSPSGGSLRAGSSAQASPPSSWSSSAYMAETLRAGIQAVPKGQTEAARSLGHERRPRRRSRSCCRRRSASSSRP